MAETLTKWESIGGNNTNRIGGNGYEFSYADADGTTQALQVDYGSLFADKAKNGCDAYIPELPRSNDILITHGHMDHIGGLAHLMNLKRDEFKKMRDEGKNLTLHCTPYAEVMIRNSLASARIPIEEFPEFHTVEDGKPFEVNGFKVEPFAVSHSIPEAVGYVVESPDGVRMMTLGDFKTAAVPLGKSWNDERIAEVAAKGVDLMFLDSTSASSPGMSKSEQDVKAGLTELLEKSSDGMIVSSVIASSAHRLHTIALSVAEYAEKTGTDPRTIIIDGGSLINARRALNSCGYRIEDIIREQTGVNIKMVAANTKTAQETPPENRFYVCTGTQGEEAAFKKIAEGNNRNVSLDDIDCPVYVYNLQSCIPGNEEKFKALEASFQKKGCTTYFPDRYKENPITIHASGHGSEGDVAKACKIVAQNSPRPTTIVPIHGGAEHRKKVMEIAQKAGLKAFIIPNFASVYVDRNGRVGFSKPAAEETWITVNDKNNDFRRPNYEYSRIALNIAAKKTRTVGAIKYPRAPWKRKEDGSIEERPQMAVLQRWNPAKTPPPFRLPAGASR